MLDRLLSSLLAALLLITFSGCAQQGAPRKQADAALDTAKPVDIGLHKIEHIIVIYGENRSFDHLYGLFPGANGIQRATAQNTRQTDRDGSLLPHLPPVWGGVNPEVPQSATADLPNAPFRIDDPAGLNQPLSAPTRDLVHRFYQNQMQINKGKLDRYAAWSDAGALVMGYYDGSALPLWKLAREYTLADNTFMAAFGGSFLNHFWLVCACTPLYSDVATSPAKGLRAVLEADGVTLTPAPNAAASALHAPPKFVNDGTLTPDGYAVNTMQPAYQPSGVPPAAAGDTRFADPSKPTTLPPQYFKTIGDTLSAKEISWGWYAGSWNESLRDRNAIYNGKIPNFQPHHHPFNYFARFAPGKPDRSVHLKDYQDLIDGIERGSLPQVVFYKPQGNLNQHPGYTDVYAGDVHMAEVIGKIQASPLWANSAIILTYDENGGFWDHVPPPAGDRWGPGTRIPLLVISPFAKRGFVDNTLYDTTSILKFITRRFDLEPLPGVRAKAGDLTNAFDFGQ